ncbi:hypothetical protein [Parasegetibacter sp. NRK P23]|uniref:hypothetical protein n=1 Tax=Parasegetibacter sp. NRK P23 TaxID=2942999 RepID=UPI0020448DC3|nr:hypothetical protein [Parasegetibacter sp. NRK P23]MCM5530647.1 hypothetical protein [Parasegetibacter sp. NRK P23]
MTPKKIEALKTKISKIKRTLAADKRKYGCYDDSRGIRYLPVKYFIELEDYKGGLAYLRWFSKNFPDDIGFPDFLFEWTIVLFKSGRIKEATKKAFETFYANTYLFDQFFGKPLIQIDKWEGSNLQTISFAQTLQYSYIEPSLKDFADWLEQTILEDEFHMRCDLYIDIQRQLRTERDQERRSDLVAQIRDLVDSY